MSDVVLTIKVILSLVVGMGTVVIMERLGVPHPGISLIAGVVLSVVLIGRFL